MGLGGLVWGSGFGVGVLVLLFCQPPHPRLPLGPSTCFWALKFRVLDVGLEV